MGQIDGPPVGDFAKVAAAAHVWKTMRVDLLAVDPENVYANLAILLRAVRAITSALTRSYIELPEMSVKLRDGKTTARIIDIEALPEGYYEIKRVPLMDKIVSDMMAGVVVPGAVPRNRLPHLTVEEVD